MPSYQHEQELENNLIRQLIDDGYEKVDISNLDELKINFRRQLNIHNKNELKSKDLSDKEFEQVMNKISGKSIFESSKILRNTFLIEREDHSKARIELFNKNEWCKNIFQVAHQITNDNGNYTNRYDVTLLINGLPLVQIELKRRGVDFIEAFRQIARYKRTSLTKGLFSFIQFFVISNGIDTKYFANNNDLKESFTFYWSDKENKRISDLKEFQTSFLNKCHVAKMIARYMILIEKDKNGNPALLIMRPYQVHAVEALINRATETRNNAYVWHTTGSGKTLTSFKLSQLLSNEAEIDKVIFLVDRRDLDSQTLTEFNSFQKDSVDQTDTTKKLLSMLKKSDSKIILTTIQKMSKACKLDKNAIISSYLNKRVIFIIDECHRSQFGEMHKEISKKFPNAQYFGFTGTPIFEENKNPDDRTTKDIFEDCLHNYLIKDAIADGNVLGFSVDYVKTVKLNPTWDKSDDKEVDDINRDEVIEKTERLKKIVRNILDIHDIKTKNRTFNALFAIKNIKMLIKYYDLFKKENHNLKIGAIFTYGQNEDLEGRDEHSRESLERIIKDYNQIYKTNFSTEIFSNYFQDISKKIKNGQIDIVLVVGMFLTGFDAKCLNTIYIDKRLKNHNLIQTFSRTNRVYDQNKTWGNIVCYQTTKKDVDEAVKLFSKENSTNSVLAKEYEEYLEDFKLAILKLKSLFSSANDVYLGDEMNRLKSFILSFRDVLKLKSKLSNFTEFDLEKANAGITEQEYQDYAGKYESVSREITKQKKSDQVSIVDDIDFCIELLKNDKIDVEYIKTMISSNQQELIKGNKEKIQDILNILDKPSTESLRLKSNLIKDFVIKIMPTLDRHVSAWEEYLKLENESREIEIKNKAIEFGLNYETLNSYISYYEYYNDVDIIKIEKDLKNNPKVKEYKEKHNELAMFTARKSMRNEIIEFIKYVVNKYM
ncbi:type I restriction endonuclease subunit R [Metamycoplasma buccale]|uniref:type I restriction endonuclease subunit R n=1 Tax=Metamycoplasma buccale TaxID=55602 RepID=UPI00398F2E0E